MSGTTGESLVLPLVAQGDAAAVRACLDRFGGLVWSLARRMLATEAEAEDAVQEIFVDVWQSAHRYDVRVASETAFIAMIARRRLIDRRRKIGRRPQETVLQESDRTSKEPPEDAAALLGDEYGRATAAFEKLTAEQRRVLRLSVFHGLSHEKIARATGMPLGTVKTHARRGLIKLRELLAEGDSAGADATKGTKETGIDAGNASSGGTAGDLTEGVGS